jgi:hypothetical protein
VNISANTVHPGVIMTSLFRNRTIVSGNSQISEQSCGLRILNRYNTILKYRGSETVQVAVVQVVNSFNFFFFCVLLRLQLL